MVNGWLKGEKLKYEGASSFNHFLRHSSASLSSKINKFNKQSRITQQQERKQRSESLFLIDSQNNPKESIEKIVALKENMMKQRQISPFVFKLKGVQLSQMTKIFSQQINRKDSNGLVVKTGAFQNCINDPQVQYVATDENSFGRSTKNGLKDTAEITALDKRNEILNYKKLLQSSIKNEQTNKLKSQSPQKMSKTLNLNRSFLKSNKNSKLFRSKSAMRQYQIKSFEDKLSSVIKKEFASTFSSLKGDFQQLNSGIKKLKL